MKVYFQTILYFQTNCYTVDKSLLLKIFLFNKNVHSRPLIEKKMYGTLKKCYFLTSVL